MQRARIWGSAVAALLLAGCSGAVHQLPPVTAQEVNLAQDEVQRAGGAPPRHAVTMPEAEARIAGIWQRLRPTAFAVCTEMGVGTCRWSLHVSSSRSMNASAGPGGVIVVNRGIVEYADSDDEIALVIGHEIAHQAAAHVAASQRNQAAGRLAGAVLLGALGALASGNGSASGPASGTVTGAAIQAGAALGGYAGRISYAKEQEREADYLAALILYRSGLDLDQARQVLVKMARASGRRETGMLDTHPAGPERLAAWDRAVQEVRDSNGALPARQ